ncbi:unnamed protein product [Boreogadus saida]
MDERLWVQNHDVDPPAVGSDCADVAVRRPDALRRSNSGHFVGYPPPGTFEGPQTGVSTLICAFNKHIVVNAAHQSPLPSAANQLLFPETCFN